VVQGQLGKSTSSHMKSKLKAKELALGPSGRAPAQ
jgi:hypothetical protein